MGWDGVYHDGYFHVELANYSLAIRLATTDHGISIKHNEDKSMLVK